MNNLFATFVDMSRSHQMLAYLLVFVLAASEAAPVVGTLVPGTAIILGISALVTTKAVALWPLMIAATLGAIAGDGAGFWLGQRYHHVITTSWPLSRYPRAIALGNSFFQRHGGKSVFIGRFVPGVKTIVPLVAGIENMPVQRFYIMNILSACLWGPLHVLAGAGIGASFDLFGAAIGRAVIVLLLLCLAVWGTTKLIGATLRRLPHLAAMWRSTVVSANPIGMRRWRELRLHRVARQQAILPWLAVAGGSLVVIDVIEDIVTKDPLVRAGTTTFNLLQSLRSIRVDHVMIASTELGDATVTLVMAAVVLLWLAAQRRWRAIGYVIAAIAGAGLFTVSVKLMLPITRPYPIAKGWDAASFPSGHTAINTAFYLSVVLVMTRELTRPWRKLLIGTTGLLISAIALSRLYLGAHWLADVLGGFGFGIAWAALLGIAYGRSEPQAVDARRLMALLALTLLVAGGFHVGRHHAVDTVRYRIRHQPAEMTLGTWHAQGWLNLPVFRVGLFGANHQPLTLQWADNPSVIKAELLASGWHNSVFWTLHSTLAWFESAPQLAALPIVPQLNNGNPSRLVMIMPIRDRKRQARYVLRLWRSNVVLTRPATGRTPLWVGTVGIEKLDRLPFGFAWVREESAVNAPAAHLAALVPSMRARHRAAADRPNGWNGTVYLSEQQ